MRCEEMEFTSLLCKSWVTQSVLPDLLASDGPCTIDRGIQLLLAVSLCISQNISLARTAKSHYIAQKKLTTTKKENAAMCL